MLTPAMNSHLDRQLQQIRSEGLEKAEIPLASPQAGRVLAAERRDMLNLCANNYLGLADHAAVVAAAKDALDRWGSGTASVRFICGTMNIHQQLETAVSGFLGMDASILYSSCFDANGGLFETLLDAQDAIISDELNHASIIDGIRLCKAQRYRFANNDMVQLESRLQQAAQAGARFIMIATDGVFSMDGRIADLQSICDLADKYRAMVMVDDSHAAGFVGPSGRGTHEYCRVMNRVDILTGTFGKAFGGGGGGYVSGKKALIDLLRQRSRPYLFSNSLPPAAAAAALAAIELARTSGDLRRRLWENAAFFRQAMTEAGFDIIPGVHPIVPIMCGDAKYAVRLAQEVNKCGVLVIPFSFPVVPHGKARIRTQMSAAHSPADLQQAVDAFITARGRIAL